MRTGAGLEKPPLLQGVVWRLRPKRELEGTFRYSESAELAALQMKFGRFLGVFLLAASAAENIGLDESLRDAAARGDFGRASELRTESFHPTIDHEERWLDNPKSYDKGIAAAIAVLQAFRPPEIDPLPYDPAQGVSYGSLFKTPDEYAEFYLRSVADQKFNWRKTAFIKTLLGDLTNRLEKYQSGPPSWELPDLPARNALGDARRDQLNRSSTAATEPRSPPDPE